MIKTVGDMIDTLSTFPLDAPIGVARGLHFAPALMVELCSTSTKFPGLVDRFNGETGGPQVVLMRFMNNSETPKRLTALPSQDYSLESGLQSQELESRR